MPIRLRLDSGPWYGSTMPPPHNLNTSKPKNARFLPIFAALVAATLTAPGPGAAAQEKPMKMMMGDMDMSEVPTSRQWLAKPRASGSSFCTPRFRTRRSVGS